MTTQTVAGARTAGDSPNGAGLHPQLRKAASTLPASNENKVQKNDYSKSKNNIHIKNRNMETHSDKKKIEKVVLSDIGELINFTVNDDFLDERIKRRWVNFAFRGVSKASRELKTSLLRNSGANKLIAEQRLLRNFEKYAQVIEPRVKNSLWENMIYAQHHGVPTRLLDWSFSPLIALHFAIKNADSPDGAKNDAVVWAINYKKLNKSLPNKYVEILEENNAIAFTLEMLEKLDVKTIDDYNKDMNGKHILFFEPPSISERIVAQSSIFSIIPDGLDPIDELLFPNSNDVEVYKFIIPKEKLQKFSDALHILNISERTLFPGLDGIGSWLKRIYFNRT